MGKGESNQQLESLLERSSQSVPNVVNSSGPLQLSICSKELNILRSKHASSFAGPSQIPESLVETGSRSSAANPPRGSVGSGQGNYHSMVVEPHRDEQSWLVQCGREAAERMLTLRVDGTFLIRPSSTGGHALSVV